MYLQPLECSIYGNNKLFIVTSNPAIFYVMSLTMAGWSSLILLLHQAAGGAFSAISKASRALFLTSGATTGGIPIVGGTEMGCPCYQGHGERLLLSRARRETLAVKGTERDSCCQGHGERLLLSRALRGAVPYVRVNGRMDFCRRGQKKGLFLPSRLPREAAAVRGGF